MYGNLIAKYRDFNPLLDFKSGIIGEAKKWKKNLRDV
jgi:hypothetical protein